jgi:hypothetical protein
MLGRSATEGAGKLSGIVRLKRNMDIAADGMVERNALEAYRINVTFWTGELHKYNRQNTDLRGEIPPASQLRTPLLRASIACHVTDPTRTGGLFVIELG